MKDNKKKNSHMKVELKDAVNIFVRRKWVFIGVFIVILIAGTLVNFLKTPMYKSSSRIEVSGVYYDDNLYKYFPRQAEELGIYATGMKSNELESGTLTRLAIDLRGDLFLREIVKELDLDIEKEELYHDVLPIIDNIARAILLEVVSSDPEKAYLINNRILEKYIEERKAGDSQVYQEILDEIDVEIDSIDKQDKSQEEYSDVINDLNEIRYNLEKNKDLYLQKITILQEPTRPSSSYNTDYLRNTVFAFFIAVVAGFIAVYIPNIFIPLKKD